MATLANKNEIFYIPVGRYFNKKEDEVNIIYAPLKGKFMLATNQMCIELEKAFANNTTDSKAINTKDAICQTQDIDFDKLTHGIESLYEIEILANNTCNFSCVYCYSAKGRSTQRLDFQNFKTLIDFLFNGNHFPKRTYAIHFSGGGEPLLSFDFIKEAIPYIQNAYRTGNQHPYKLGLVTNGSLLTLPIAKYLKDNNVEIIISFEILEDLQNKERGNYERVSANIQMLTENNIPFGTRTTFTPDSVHRMCEMVNVAHSKFPGMRNLTFDVVLAPQLFNTPQDLDDYYIHFLDEYYKAKELAKSYNMGIGCLAAEPLHNLRDRACYGKMVLTPWGKISSCARISSPKEALYPKYVWGEINGSTLKLDADKFASIIEECNIYTQEHCKSCFARWNCGGGCKLLHDSFRKEYSNAYCHFQQEALTRQIIDLINKSCLSKTGQTIFENIK